jgi:two-component system, NtrC family, sensor kinase
MSIRFKLIMGAIAIILVANSVLAIVNVVYLERVWMDEVQTRVRLDLNSASIAYKGHMEGISRFLRAAALDRSLVMAIESDAKGPLTALLDKVYRSAETDFLCLLDAKGKVIRRARNPGKSGDSLAEDPLVAGVLRQGESSAGSVIVPAAVLAREGDDLAAKARFTLLPTPAARPTDDVVRADGMVVAAAVPIRDDHGKLLGILYGGDLLNRRYALIDAIRQNVFPPETYEGKEIGTVTIFQGDLRIATNVLREDGSPAVGTRLSEAVHKEVLEEGGTWAAPAFVVNDWYITAYGPIKDPQDRIIGAIYAGLLRAPFADAQRATAWRFVAMMVLATVASLVLIFFVTMLVMRPVGRIVGMSRRVIGGDLSARVGIRPPGEIGVLCQAIDAMADAVAERETRLKQAARQQVTRAEKLASIGRLAAGVAHEINNPLTGVLTFAHLLHDKPSMDQQDKQDLELIIHETTRAAEIVRGLLDFARERPTLMEPLDLNDVVRRTVRLIANQKKFEHIIIEEALQTNLPAVCGDMNQLQQVLLNLSLNACAAMPTGGRITIATSAKDGRVLMKVADTGCGIKEEHLERIFEPFFTTQPQGKGTGLGLSVTYGIVEQHGGTIEVESKESEGSVFTISLPGMKVGEG